MIQTMLDYTKLILERVSFDESLFKKEIEKAFKVLLPEEVQQLLNWAREKFKNEKVYALIPV